MIHWWSGLGSFARSVRAFGCLSVLLVCAGCSGFNRDWKVASRLPPPPGELAGRWEGTWQSDVTGHTDRLRCLVTPGPAGGYWARFHARYHKLVSLSFGYTVPLTVTQTNGVAQFRGDADLGWLAGGLYHYEGHADKTDFFATYHSQADHGTFRLIRP